ncbi:hypothetical protein ACMGDH_09435 [Sphingomonas sp. DT-207]|uniref:hypothetical protein n=1 Tax=Sphingomonas sp. DT-207 TaxID=3396167 RepID=UPI003F1D4DCA
MSLLSKLFGRQKPNVLNREQFADHYVKVFAEKAPELSAERDGVDIRMRRADGGTINLFLGNAHAQYRNEPEVLEALIEAHLASARASAAPQAPLDLNLVLPLIKSRSWLATAAAQIGDDVDLVIRPFVSDLIIVPVQDLPSTMAFVKRQHLEGVCDEAQLFARAMSNLAGRAAGLQAIGGNGRYRIELDGFFDASLILVAADWIGQLDLEGDPVFAIPCRDQLMVCGSDDAEAVAELAEIAPQIATAEAYDISAELLTLKGGKIEIV